MLTTNMDKQIDRVIPIYPQNCGGYKYVPFFEFHFSTFSITDIFYGQNARRTMSLRLLIIKLCSFF